MIRIVSTAAFIILIVAVAAVAVYALNGQPAAQTAAAPAAVPGSASVHAPEAVAAAANFNAIAVPLDVTSNWASGGHNFDAQGLAEYVGEPSVDQVLHLNASTQGYDSWYPATQDGFVNGAYTTIPFALSVGGAYRLVLNNSDPNLDIVSFVGDVPDAGSIKFTLVGADGGCKFQDVSIPLEQSGLTDADLLSDSMGGLTDVEQVLQLNPSTQGYDSWYPATQDGFVNGSYTTVPFETKIGYPYAVCLLSGANGVVWP